MESINRLRLASAANANATNCDMRWFQFWTVKKRRRKEIKNADTFFFLQFHVGELNRIFLNHRIVQVLIAILHREKIFFQLKI